MANNTSSSGKDESVSEQHGNVESPAVPPTTTSSMTAIQQRSPTGFNWLSIAALAVAIIALVAAIFAWYQVAVTGRLEVGAQRSSVDRVVSEFTDMKSHQTGQDEAIAALRGEVAKVADETRDAVDKGMRLQDENLDRFREEFNTLKRSVEKVYEDFGRSVDTWSLEETEQLLLLANQRLSLVRDVHLASTALRLADSKLEEIGDPALLPVRRQIADELAALAEVPGIDVAGNVLALDALAKRVPRLPLSEDMNRPEWQTGEASTDDTADTGLSEVGRQILDDLQKLVRVRKVEETRLPKLKPVQRFLVDENLRVMLNAAQYALLRGDIEVFKNRIDAARQWLDRYFDVGDDAVIKFAGELDHLASQPMAVELPSISASLELLRRHIDERTSQ